MTPGPRMASSARSRRRTLVGRAAFWRIVPIAPTMSPTWASSIWAVFSAPLGFRLTSSDRVMGPLLPGLRAGGAAIRMPEEEDTELLPAREAAPPLGVRDRETL